MNHFNSNCS